MISIDTKASALTLIEVLVVLAIVAILAVAAVPLYQAYVIESRIKGASEGLYHALILARTEALKRQANVKVVFQTGSSWCYGVTTASTCDCNSAGACDLGQANSANYTGTSLSLTTIVDNIVFEGYRGSVTPTGSISFTAGSDAVNVTINAMGRATICSNNIGGYMSC